MQKLICFIALVIVFFLSCVSLTAAPTDEESNIPDKYHSVNVISGEFVESMIDLTLSGPHPYEIKRWSFKDDKKNATTLPNWVILPLDYFYGVLIPLKEKIFPTHKMLYDYDRKGALTDVKWVSLDNQTIFNSLKINRSNEDRLEIESRDGRKVTYELQTTKDGQKLLTKVNAPGETEIRYTYSDHPSGKYKVLTSRLLPQYRGTYIDYYPAGDSKGKVKALREVVGTDPTPIVVSEFFYELGQTTVLDAARHKTIYKYTPDKKLIAIESQHPDGSSSPYRTHRFYWQNGVIVSRTVENDKQEILVCRTFAYDYRGNVIRETLYGNITGQNSKPITVDSNGQPINSKSLESYSRIFIYSNDKESVLLSEREDNGTEIRYSYHSTFRTIESKLTYFKGQILRREFYVYDGSANLIQHIQDDGRSSNRDDLQGVTERHIKVVTALKDGLPTTLEDRCLDLPSETEIVLKKTVNIYSPEGWLIEQQLYDSEGVLKDKLMNTYDEQGRLLTTTDRAGHTKTSAYDIFGNVTRCASTEDQTETNFLYDFAGHVIKKEELDTEGKYRITSYRFDPVGNCTASIDSCGNTTEYVYDALNRLIKTKSPAILDENGQVINIVQTKDYDIFDRVVKTRGPEGETCKTYNVRGQPIEIIYPDQTRETNSYNLDGTLQKNQNRKGITTAYRYDGLKRPVEVIQTDRDGNIITRVTSKYNGFHLLEQSDISGQGVNYRYDAAGNLISEIGKGKHIEYFYDIFGQAKEKREWFGPLPGDYRATCTERDAQNQVVSVVIKDSSGNLLRILPMNKEQELPPEFPEIETKVLNDRGQTVWQTSSTNALGVTTETTLDALNRVEALRRIDPYGNTLTLAEYLYDAMGNTCRETYHVFSQNSPDTTFSIVRQWNLQRQLLEVIEGEGTPLQKITRYRYDPYGQIEQILKPDGTQILQTWNSRGQLIGMSASDRSFDYSYDYDDFGNIQKAIDNLSQTVTLRSFDAVGHLTAEQLGGGLKSEWQYDELGRITQHILPDKTTVDYLYDAVYLNEIKRKDLTYRYTYDHAYGRVTQAEMIGGIGTLQYHYGTDKVPCGLETPYWSQEIPPDGRDQGGRLIHTTIKDPLGTYTFDYQYNLLSGLTQEKGPETHSYDYDSLNNRRSKDGRSVDYNHLNQIVAGDIAYDPNGNMIKMGGLELTYDALNRLIRVDNADQVRYDYLYDPLGRRIAKTKSTWNDRSKHWNIDSTVRYFYQGDIEIGAADEKGNIIELRILGVGIGADIGAAVAIELKDQTYAPIHDLQGNVRCLVDVKTRQPAEFYRYTAFGEVSVYDLDGNVASESILGNPWLFSSKRLDAETGFYHFGKRHYCPTQGRWLTPDPLGFGDGPNLYCFVHNNPLNSYDLYGQFSFSDIWEKISAFFTNLFDKIKNFFYDVGDWFRTYLSPAAMRDYLEFIGEKLIGFGYALFLGDRSFVSHQGIYGQGEISDKARVTFINGIANEPHHVMFCIEDLSESHGNVNVHYVYSATRGFLLDVIRAAKVRFGHTSPEAYLLLDTWRQMIAEMGGTDGGGKIIHYAHSIGAGDTERALALMSDEERRMIEVYTFGSPMLLKHEKPGETVLNFINIRDGISLLDPFRYLKALLAGDHQIVFIGVMDGIPLIDHYFRTDSYQRVWETLGRYFVKIYGGAIYGS